MQLSEHDPLVKELEFTYFELREVKRALLLDMRDAAQNSTHAVNHSAAGAVANLMTALRGDDPLPENTLTSLPPTLRTNAAAYSELHERLNTLLSTPDGATAAESMQMFHVKSLRIAILLHKQQRQANIAGRLAQDIYAQAWASQRFITSAETAAIKTASLETSANTTTANTTTPAAPTANPANPVINISLASTINTGTTTPLTATPPSNIPSTTISSTTVPATTITGMTTQSSVTPHDLDQTSSLDTLLSEISSPLMRDRVLQNLATLRVREAHRELRAGLLLTGQMQTIINDSLPALLRGEPLLLIGETGGAKTALAEYLAAKVNSADHEFISGYGDISSTQVIGAHELRVKDGATESRFVEGPLLRAMSRGTPVILDEINAMPPEFLKRLNRILQLLPGETYRVQENAGRSVTVASGFVIIATANEQASDRYRGIFSLSSELVNRFGANTFRVHYPDADNDFRADPAENLLLALVGVADERGSLPPHVTTAEVLAAARFAFISQQVFAGRYGEGFDDFVSNDNRVDGRPGLEESVLAPRTLVKLLGNVRASGGALTVARALERFVDGVMNQADRAVLKSILRSQLPS